MDPLTAEGGAMERYYSLEEATKLTEMSRHGIYWHARKKNIRTAINEKGIIVYNAQDVDRIHLQRSRSIEARVLRTNPKGTNWPSPEEIQKADIHPLRKAIMLAKQTLKTAAEVLGVSYPTLSQILNGWKNLSDKVAYKAEEKYGCDFATTKRYHQKFMMLAMKSRMENPSNKSRRPLILKKRGTKRRIES
jgi:plasmid maintenance system antidote protein VapI